MLSAPVAKKSLASIPAFQSGDQKGIDGKFSRNSFNLNKNTAWSSENIKEPSKATKNDQIKRHDTTRGQAAKSRFQS